jgi:hypothetical protein
LARLERMKFIRSVMALVSYIACESKGVMLFRPAEETVDVLAAMIARAGGLPLYRAL